MQNPVMETKCKTIGRNVAQMGTPCPPTESKLLGLEEMKSALNCEILGEWVSGNF